MVKALIIALTLPLISGCATTPIMLGLPCSIGPIILDKGASTRLTTGEKQQVVVVNRTGEKLCQWKPPAK